LLAELALGRKRVTRLEPARDDRFDDVRRDPIRQAGLPRKRAKGAVTWCAARHNAV
jgi:hypothetical protein